MKKLIIYALFWFLVFAAAFAVYFTGYFNQKMETVFGLIFATLYFAGIVMVLPFQANERYS